MKSSVGTIHKEHSYKGSTGSRAECGQRRGFIMCKCPHCGSIQANFIAVSMLQLLSFCIWIL